MLRDVRAIMAVVLATAACSNGDAARIFVRTVSDTTGAPVSGVRVQVEAQPWVTTGADGTATFSSIRSPFTVRVHQSRPNGDAPRIFVLRGRTGSAVVAEVDGAMDGFSSFRQAVVSGIVSGRSAQPSSSVVVSVGQRAADFGAAAGGDGSFEFTALWQADPAAKVTVRARETDGANPPGHYYGFGSTAASVVDGAPLRGVALRLEPVPVDRAGGTASVPAALGNTPRVEGFLWLSFGPYEQLLLQSTAVAPESFALVVPTVAGAEAWLRVQGVGSGGAQAWHQRRVNAAASDLAFSLPAPPDLVEPVAGAAVGRATTFRWTAPERSGSSKLLFRCEWLPAGFAGYLVEAPGVEATLPEVPQVSVPQGATCTWAVFWCAGGAAAVVRDNPAVEARCAWSVSRAATQM